MKSTKQLAKNIRRNALEMVHNANASHIASALSIADILAVLYNDIMVLDSKKENTLNRDRFILSKGHACTALYSVLAEMGYFNKAELSSYGKDYSKFMNHASHYVDGIEFSMGALGHGLPIGCGLAMASKLKKESWQIYIVLSDGELQEGSNWEAFLFAAHNNLSNINICIDFNNQQSLTTVDKTLTLQPLNKKLISFGWDCEIIDGHNHKELKNALLMAKESERPFALICNTIKGKGVSFMENNVSWHYKSPNKEELIQAYKEIEENK